MKTLLLTYFEPFGGREVNLSGETAAHLGGSAGGWLIKKLLLPVEFGKAARLAAAEAERISADAVLCLGEAGERSAVTPELVAVNLRCARIPDNAGRSPQDEPCVPGGENALFSTLPARRMAAAMEAAGVPTRVSYSAGAYVCNDTMYTLLARFRNTPVAVGFIHLPVDAGLEPKALAAAVEAAIKAI